MKNTTHNPTIWQIPSYTFISNNLVGRKEKELDKSNQGIEKEVNSKTRFFAFNVGNLFNMLKDFLGGPQVFSNIFNV